jgi:hypothetical protein
VEGCLVWVEVEYGPCFGGRKKKRKRERERDREMREIPVRKWIYVICLACIRTERKFVFQPKYQTRAIYG